jgi:hypothetical protein
LARPRSTGAPPNDRRQRQQRQGRRGGELQPGRGRERRCRLARVDPGLVEQLDGERGGRPRHEPADGGPAQLRGGDREPGPRCQPDPVQLPQTHIAGGLAGEHEDRKGPVQVQQRPPRRKDRDQRRQQQVERDPADQQEHAGLDVLPPGTAARGLTGRAARRPGMTVTHAVSVAAEGRTAQSMRSR